MCIVPRPALLLALLLLPTLSLAEVPVAEPGVVVADAREHVRFDPLVVAGDGFLVVWEEARVGGIVPFPTAVMVRAYDADGRPRRPVATAIPFIVSDPHVVWTGSEYLVAGATTISRIGTAAPIPVLLAFRLDVNGSVIEASQVTLVEARSQAAMVSLAWDGQKGLAYLEADGQRRLLELNAQGRIIGSNTSTNSVAPIALVAAPGAGSFALFARDGDVAAVAPGAVAIIDNTSIGAIVTLRENGQQADAFLIAPPEIPIRSIVWDGSAWLVVYATESAICTARFTREANLVRDCETQTTPRAPSIAALAGRTFKAWGRGLEQILTDSGTASLVSAPQIGSSATIDSEGLLIAWIEEGRIHLGGPGRVRRIVGEAHNVTFVRVAPSLLVWISDGAVWVMRLNAPGAPMRLGDGVAPVAVASRGSGWLLTWQQEKEIVSTFLTANGDTNGLAHFGSAGVRQFAPRVAATPAGFIIAWAEDEIVGAQRWSRVVAEPLDANGLRISGGVRFFDRTLSSADVLRVVVGCNAAGCLLATGGPSDIVPIGFDAQPVGERKRVVDFGSDKFFIPRTDGTFDLYSGQYVMSIRADGTLINVRRWMTTDSMYLGAVVPFGNTFLAVYNRFANGTQRVFLRDLAVRARAARH